MNKIQKIMEKLFTDTQVRLTGLQFIKLVNSKKLLGNVTDENRYTDDPLYDDEVNNKVSAFSPVAMVDFEYNKYISVGRGRVFTPDSIYTDAYREDADLDAIKKEAKEKFVIGTRYFAKNDIIGYNNKKGYFWVDIKSPTIIEAKIGSTYYSFKTTDNKDLFQMFK